MNFRIELGNGNPGRARQGIEHGPQGDRHPQASHQNPWGGVIQQAVAAEPAESHL